MGAICVAGRKNIYDILTQHDAYSVLPPSQKLFVFNTNNPLDLVFQSLRRQGMQFSMICNTQKLWRASFGIQRRERMRA